MCTYFWVSTGIRTSTAPAMESVSTAFARVTLHGLARPARFKFARTIVPIVMDRASVTGRAITVTACTVSRVRFSIRGVR